MQVKLQAVTPDAEKNIVEIARVSSSRIDKTEAPEGLINYLIKHKHWSPFEHGFMTLEITTSKAIAIQYLRHRSFTFQEFSQRYAKVTKLEPVEFRKQAETNRQSSTDFMFDIAHAKDGFIEVMNCENSSLGELGEEVSEILDASLEMYHKLLGEGVAKECARMVLPMCTETTLYMSGPIRSWIHMMDIRDDAHAQKEAQLIARECKKIFIEQFPLISKARGYTL